MQHQNDYTEPAQPYDSYLGSRKIYWKIESTCKREKDGIDTPLLSDASNERLERDQNDDNIARKEQKNVIVIGVPWQANIDCFNTKNRKENMQ